MKLSFLSIFLSISFFAFFAFSLALAQSTLKTSCGKGEFLKLTENGLECAPYFKSNELTGNISCRDGIITPNENTKIYNLEKKAKESGYSADCYHSIFVKFKLGGFSSAYKKNVEYENSNLKLSTSTKEVNIFASDYIYYVPSTIINLKKLEDGNALFALNGYSFNFKDSSKRKSIGILAQEVEEVLPNLVTMNSEGYRTVSYGSLVPLIIESLKDLDEDLDKLDSSIKELELISKR